VKNCDAELKTKLCQIAAFYEHWLQKGNKAIYHMEAFVAKFMAIYMKFVKDTFGGFLN
jgi:replication factor C subunit 3/5